VYARNQSWFAGHRLEEIPLIKPCAGLLVLLLTAAIPDLHDRPIVDEEGRTLLWATQDAGGNVEWFDMTGATIDPRRFQFGIGRDSIMSIDAPEFVPVDDPRVAERGISLDTPVLGVQIEGIARAYPVRLMDLHEVVNDEFAGKAYAVLW
jgi:hypothetical protein